MGGKERFLNNLLRFGPETIKATKRLLNEAYVPHESISIEHMLDVHLDARQGSEATEGLAAFLAKRLPSWMTSSKP